MANQLVYNTQCEIGELTYIFEVYKGTTFRMGEFEFNGKHYKRSVEIKAFSIVIKEVVTNGNTQLITSHDCGFITARTSEFKYAIEGMAEQCENLFEMKLYVVGLEERFSAAMNRDAARALKGIIKPHLRKPANVHKQLPQK
jgi:hypothetical protein